MLHHTATALTPEMRAELDDILTCHTWNYDQIARGSLVRIALQAAIGTIIEQVPPGPDRTVAIRKIREARMDCNSAITHGGRY